MALTEVRAKPSLLWNGQPLDHLSNEDLIEAVYWAYIEIKRLRSMPTVVQSPWTFPPPSSPICQLEPK